MAEQTEITNVGGDGVASEVTLQRLVSAVDKLARAGGGGGGGTSQAAKDVEKFGNSLKSGVKVSTKNSDAIKNNTKATKSATQALNKFSRGLAGALTGAISSLTASMTGLVTTFASGATRMDAFASQLPLIGDSIAPLVGILDNTFASFQNVASSGASFNNSMLQLRVSAAEAGMTLDEYGSMVARNTDLLATFGGTATQGAMMISRMSRALGGQREDLLNMGLTFEEINESLITYQALNRAGSRAQNRSVEEQAAAAAGYTKNLLKLSKLSGEDIKSQEAKIRQAQQDVAFQRRLATMDANERDKINQLMAEAMQSGGQTAVDALKAEFLGMPPITQEVALYQTQFRESFGALQQGLQEAQDTSIESAEFSARANERLLDVMAGNASAAERLGPLLDAAAAGADGAPAQLSAMFNEAGLKFTDYLDTSGNFQRERALADLQAADAENSARDDATSSMASFMETLATVRSTFETNVITPIIDSLSPALTELTTYFSEITSSDEFKNTMSDIGTSIAGFKDKVQEFMTAFAEDPKQALKDLWDNATSGLVNMLKDFFLGAEVTTMGPNGPETKREGGFIDETLKPMMSELGTVLVNGMKDGIKYLWEETSIIETMVAGIAALWAAPKLLSAMTSGIGSLVSRGMNRMRGGAGAGGAGAGGAGAGGNAARGAGNAARSVGGQALRRLGAVGAIGYGLYEGYQGFSAADEALERGEITESEATVQKSEAVGGAAGGTGGALAGAAAGALAGSVVPVVGTAIGGLIGGAIGWWAGNAGGEMVGEMIGEAIAEPDVEIDNQQPQTAAPTMNGWENMSQEDILNMYAPNTPGTPTPTPTLETETTVDTAPETSYNVESEEFGRKLDALIEAQRQYNESSSASTSTSVESLNELNRTMAEIRTYLEEIRDSNDKVEKHTKSFGGGNIANGYVSTIR